MKIIDKILKKLDDRQINKLINKINRNNRNVSIPMYSDMIAFIKSIRWSSYEIEREIEFINGEKIKCLMSWMR